MTTNDLPTEPEAEPRRDDEPSYKLTVINNGLVSWLRQQGADKYMVHNFHLSKGMGERLEIVILNNDVTEMRFYGRSLGRPEQAERQPDPQLCRDCFKQAYHTFICPKNKTKDFGRCSPVLDSEREQPPERQGERSESPAPETTPPKLTNAEWYARGLARSRYHNRLFAASQPRPTNEQFDEGWEAARQFYAPVHTEPPEPEHEPHFDSRSVDPRTIPEKWLSDVKFFDHIQGASGVCTWQCAVCFQKWDSNAKLPCPRCRPNWKDELAVRVPAAQPPGPYFTPRNVVLLLYKIADRAWRHVDSLYGVKLADELHGLVTAFAKEIEKQANLPAAQGDAVDVLTTECERLKKALTSQGEAIHFHECTVGNFYDCPNSACRKTRELLKAEVVDSSDD